jgi:phosphomannomutase/phosphoglucomutase
MYYVKDEKMNLEKSKRLFGTNGIRGIVNEELTPEFVLEIAEAVGTFFRQGNILVGFDGRKSNIMLTNVVTSGLIAAGCKVYDVGMIPTPCLQYAVKNHGMDGGVMITASHNPPEYNGMKVMGKDGVEITRQQEEMIEEFFFKKDFKFADWDKIGKRVVLSGVLDEYRESIFKHVDVDLIRRRQYHIVIDGGNGVGSLVTPYLARDLGCKVTTINCNIDGSFPGRMPEPKPENLQDLAASVVAVGADLGVAFDGDADRSIFVDDKGNVQWGDRSFALVEQDFLIANHGEKIVTPVSSSQVVKDVAEKYGGELIWTKVGSTIVSHTMKRLKAKLGGEENGGIFYGPHQPVRDGAMSTALILQVMAKTERTLYDLFKALPRYYLYKDKVECPSEKKAAVLEGLNKEVEHLNPERIDGVKLWFSDNSSILIRPSGTESIYRFYAEAKTRERAIGLVDEYKQKIQHIISY